jgi:hypothetical protein
VLFKPLSQAYSNKLTNHLHKAQGLIAIKKGDFFPLFWSTWISSFTENLIFKVFEATGIWLMDAEVILCRFASTPEAERSSLSELSDHDWRKIDQSVRAAVTDSHQYKARKLRSCVHHLSVQYELLKHENKGLKEALQHKQKHKKKSKALIFNSARSIAVALSTGLHASCVRLVLEKQCGREMRQRRNSKK